MEMNVMITKKYAWTICIGLALLAATAAARVDLQKERGGFSANFIEKFDVSPGGELKMENLQGDVQITGGHSGQVEVIQEFFLDVDTEEEARGAFERYRAKVTKSGNRIVVTGPDRSRRRYVSTSYRVKVPGKFNVDVETMGGDIQLEQLQGKVDLETMGGDVEVSDVTGDLNVETAGGDISTRETEGGVRLETAGGDIELRDGRKGPFTLKTAGGDITLRSIDGNVKAGTSGGDVEAREIEGDLDLSTSGGDITMQNVKGASHSASTYGGDIEARDVEGHVELKTAGGDVSAIRIQGDVYGRTSGGDVEVSEITGDVDVSTAGGSLDLSDVTGKLVGKTSGGDVRARVNKDTGLKKAMKLSSSGGDIVLQLPSDVKASVTAEIRLQDPFEDYTVHSDFKLKIEEDEEKGKRSRWYRTVSATGDINGGGPLIELKTVEGDITIEKRN